VTNRPDIIHASSPGPLVGSAILFAKLLRIPLVVSYHTHIPEYIPRYNLWTGLVIKFHPRLRVEPLVCLLLKGLVYTCRPDIQVRLSSKMMGYRVSWI
jgi:glycosyltransferase involved in cell wall biosynthesis